jgi:hypothetical protein
MDGIAGAIDSTYFPFRVMLVPAINIAEGRAGLSGFLTGHRLGKRGK